MAARRYGARVLDDFKTYLEARMGYYLLEQRWRNAPFWRSRFAAMAEPEGVAGLDRSMPTSFC